MTRYDSIGHGYRRTRHEDPRIAASVHRALGDARTVVNVGAGTGSYEPHDRHVVAIEPSDVMASQRPRDVAPAIRASAGALPLRDDSVDAAMAVLTIHHWDDEQERGVRELRRVARGPVVILTYDARISARMWLMAEYLHEVRELTALIYATRRHTHRRRPSTPRANLPPMRSPAEVLADVERLVGAWCDRRCLDALRAVLSGWPLSSGLTDDWATLLDALEEVRAFGSGELTADELALVEELIHDVGQIVGKRLGLT